MRILIVEDDREAAAYIVKAMTEAGHVADHAADGEEGYEMASRVGHLRVFVSKYEYRAAN